MKNNYTIAQKNATKKYMQDKHVLRVVVTKEKADLVRKQAAPLSISAYINKLIDNDIKINSSNICEDIKKIVQKQCYECYGIRVDYEPVYKIGDLCNNSHQWWQDDPEDGSRYNKDIQCWDGGELPGTCAIQVTKDNVIQALEEAETYFGNHLSLIAGNEYMAGNDINEVIISNAVVLFTSKKSPEANSTNE